MLCVDVVTAIKTSLGRTRTKHSSGPRARFKAHLQGRSRGLRRGGGGGGGVGVGGGGEGERREIGSGCYILRDHNGPRAGPAAVSNLATFGAAGSRVLAGDRVKGIYIHFDPNNPIPRIPIWNTISVLAVYTYILLFLLLFCAFSFPRSPLLSRFLLPPPLLVRLIVQRLSSGSTTNF